MNIEQFNTLTDFELLVGYLKPFIGVPLKLMEKYLPDNKEYPNWGKNGWIIEDFCSMLIYGIYQHGNSYGPDLGIYECKYVTCYDDKHNPAGDVTICKYNKNEKFEDSNFKKKMENIFFVIGISKRSDSGNGCFVDVLRLIPKKKYEFFQKLERDYNRLIPPKYFNESNFEILNISPEENKFTHGVRKDGILRYDYWMYPNTNIKLTAKGLMNYTESCFLKDRGNSFIDINRPLVWSALENPWKKISQTPMLDKAFHDRLLKTSGYRAKCGRPDFVKKLKTGQTYRMRDGAILKPFYNGNGIMEISVTYD